MFFTYCNSDRKIDKKSILLEVSELKSLDEKKEYLEDILLDIQTLQSKEARILNIEGEDSKEYLNLKSEAVYLDALNLEKIGAYFDTYGYPSRAELGQFAAFAPYAVIYYSQDKNAINEAHFKYFYGAYKFKDIPEELFYSYLKTYYAQVKLKNFEENPFKADIDNIYKLLDELGIEY